MARCVLCSLSATRGYLCDAHGKAIASTTLTSEQVVGTPPKEPVASLLDPWGDALPIDTTAAIGRAPGKCQIAILHPSVSEHHATITKRGDRWVLVDESSRNGTFVDGKRVTDVTLSDGARIQLGEIALFFVGQPLSVRPRTEGAGRTAPTRRDQLIFTAKLDMHSGSRIELAQRVEGGVLRVGDAAVELGKLEFRLLQILTEARQTNADPELAYMSWQQLASRLEFKSHEADSENVRELVRRVRRKLQAAGVEELLESKHGVGYRVSADPVEA